MHFYQALFVKLYVCRDAWVLWLLWDVRVAQWRSTERMKSQLGAEALKSRHETSYLRARCEPFVSVELVYISLPLYFWNSNISLCWTLCCNSRIYVITHFYVGYVYVMYYFTIIISIMMPRDDPGETNRPCLRAERHNAHHRVQKVRGSIGMCFRFSIWLTKFFKKIIAQQISSSMVWLDP
jgi:hypothetical protein